MAKVGWSLVAADNTLKLVLTDPALCQAVQGLATASLHLDGPTATTVGSLKPLDPPQHPGGFEHRTRGLDLLIQAAIAQGRLQCLQLPPKPRGGRKSHPYSFPPPYSHQTDPPLQPGSLLALLRPSVLGTCLKGGTEMGLLTTPGHGRCL